jgi:hypothetical protein
MNRRLLILPGTIAIAGVLALGACTSTTPAASVALPSIALPSIALPSIVVPSIVIPSIVIPSIEIPSIGPDESFSLPSIGPIPSLDLHAAPDLEAVLPSQIRGVTLEKTSVSGAFFLGSGGSPEFQALLNQFGKQPSDLAIAGAQDPSSTLDFDLAVFRLSGVDSQQLLGAFLQVASSTASTPPQVSQASLGGKTVTVVTDSSGSKSYVYGKSEFLFLASSTASDADALLGDVFSALP